MELVGSIAIKSEACLALEKQQYSYAGKSSKAIVLRLERLESTFHVRDAHFEALLQWYGFEVFSQNLRKLKTQGQRSYPHPAWLDLHR